MTGHTAGRSGRAAHPEPAPSEARPSAAPVRPAALGVPAVLALQRTAGNAAVTRMLARQAHHATQIDRAKVWFYWGATWWPKSGGGGTDVSDQSGRRKLTVPVQAGSEGQLVMRVVAHVEPLVQLGDHVEWLLKSWCEWAVKVMPDGTLTIGDPAPSSVGETGAPLQQAGAPQGGASKDVAQFTLTQGYAGTSTSYEVSVPVVGGAARTDNEPAFAAAQSFVAQLDVQGVEPREPQVDIGKVRVFQRQAHDVRFFREANVAVSGGERAKLMAWYAGLSTLTRRRLKAGKQTMRLETYASTTGPADANQLTYANGRLHAVQAILNRFVTKWDATPFGEDRPPEGGAVEPAEERPGHERPDPSRLIARLTVEDERTPGPDEADAFDLLPED